MKDIQEFFQCCHSKPADSEITVNMQRKKKAADCVSPEERIFIKRSVGRNPILDLSGHHSNRSTIYTPKQTLDTSARIRQGSSRNISHCGVNDFGLQKMEGNEINQQHGARNWMGKRDRAEYEALLADGIGFSGQIRNHNGNRHLNAINTQGFQQQGGKVINSRPSYDRRVIIMRENGGIIHPQQLGPESVGLLMHTMKSILETIEEKESVPSISQSQMNQMRQISSKATIKSNLIQRNQNRSSQLTFANKYGSVVVERKLRAMKMASSEDPLKIESNRFEESPKDTIQRLETEKALLKEQLSGLIEEQKFLGQQKAIKTERQRRQFNDLDKTGQEYKQKLRVCESQLTQIKQILKEYAPNQAI